MRAKIIREGEAGHRLDRNKMIADAMEKVKKRQQKVRALARKPGVLSAYPHRLSLAPFTGLHFACFVLSDACFPAPSLFLCKPP